jgi:hypothetical protein
VDVVRSRNGGTQARQEQSRNHGEDEPGESRESRLPLNGNTTSRAAIQVTGIETKSRNRGASI